MGKTIQLTVWVDNTPGQMARIARALAKARVNITAFTAYETENGNPIRLLVTNPVKAKLALQALDLRVTEDKVLRLTLADRPGQLAAISERLAQLNINVEYAYASIGKGAKQGDLVLAVSDLNGAIRALKDAR